MNEAIKKWLLLADIDLQTAHELFKNNNNFLYISICFHCQQAIEKYLKAVLIYYNIKPPKTHNLYEILKQCINFDNNFNYLKDLQIDKLTIYAIEIRYPDDFYIPTINEAKEAIELAIKTKEFVLKKLNEKENLCL